MPVKSPLVPLALLHQLNVMNSTPVKSPLVPLALWHQLNVMNSTPVKSLQVPLALWHQLNVMNSTPVKSPLVPLALLHQLNVWIPRLWRAHWFLCLSFMEIDKEPTCTSHTNASSLFIRYISMNETRRNQWALHRHQLNVINFATKWAQNLYSNWEPNVVWPTWQSYV